MGDRPVVVLGASGLLGHVVIDRLSKRAVPVTGICRTPRTALERWDRFGIDAVSTSIVGGVDAADDVQLAALLTKLRPGTIVNCIGLTPRRDAFADHASVMGINASLPHRLAAWADAHDCRMITLSTDCVFGVEPGGFTEGDAPTAADLYGRSKLLGEVADGDVVTLRTSFVGREFVHRTELLEWFLRHRRGRVNGFTDVWYSGVSVHHAADVIIELATVRRDVRGVYHLATPTPISKHDLLVLANEAFDADVEIVADATVSSHRTLDGSRLRELLDLATPTWAEMMAALAADDRYD